MKGDLGGCQGLPLQTTITYAILIAEALQAAHEQGIIHRDIKSENIMVNTKNQIKVMDFGLAKLKGTLKLTKTSSTVGTLAYSSPEQIQGQEVDVRSDIFSFGVVLYEMLTGQLPFKGEYESAMIYSIVNEEPEPIQKFAPDVSSEMIHITNRVLEKDPEDRYQSMKEIIDQLSIHHEQSSVTYISSTDNKSRVKKRYVLKNKLPFLKNPWAAGLVFTFIVFLWFLMQGKKGTTKIPFKNMQITHFTTHGKTGSAAISQDGKYIAYVLEEKGLKSMWLN